MLSGLDVLVSPRTEGGGEKERREEEESKGGGVEGGYIPMQDKPDARRRPSGKHQMLAPSNSTTGSSNK